MNIAAMHLLNEVRGCGFDTAKTDPNKGIPLFPLRFPRLWENLCKLDSSMIMKGEKLTNQAFHPCFIYNSYCQACQEQAAGRLS